MKDIDPADRRDEAVTALHACLLRDNSDDWVEVQPILRKNLTEKELGSIAWAALRAMPGETAFDVAQAALECGWAFLPTLDPEDKQEAVSTAKLWVADASQTEIKAVAMVAVESMAPRSRAGFSEWIKKKELE